MNRRSFASAAGGFALAAKPLRALFSVFWDDPNKTCLSPPTVRCVGGCSVWRNHRHFADGQATGVNVGYGASILGRLMSATAAFQPVNPPDRHSPPCEQNQALALVRYA